MARVIFGQEKLSKAPELKIILCVQNQLNSTDLVTYASATHNSFIFGELFIFAIHQSHVCVTHYIELCGTKMAFDL
jgi:hypothetical protein